MGAPPGLSALGEDLDGSDVADLEKIAAVGGTLPGR
jgi:hypothetical protein